MWNRQSVLDKTRTYYVKSEFSDSRIEYDGYEGRWYLVHHFFSDGTPRRLLFFGILKISEKDAELVVRRQKLLPRLVAKLEKQLRRDIKYDPEFFGCSNPPTRKEIEKVVRRWKSENR